MFVFEAGNCPGFGELFCPVMQLNYFFLHATIAYFRSFLYIHTLIGSGVTLLTFVYVISRKCMVQNNVIGNICSDKF